MLVCLLVNQHPSPLDDCPRFEDAIAFISVVLGSRELLDSKRVAALNAGLFTSVTPGAAFDLPALVTTWVLLALLKVTTGILVVLSWRMLAKPIVRTPPPRRRSSATFHALALWVSHIAATTRLRQSTRAARRICWVPYRA